MLVYVLSLAGLQFSLTGCDLKSTSTAASYCIALRLYEPDEEDDDDGAVYETCHVKVALCRFSITQASEQRNVAEAQPGSHSNSEELAGCLAWLGSARLGWLVTLVNVNARGAFRWFFDRQLLSAASLAKLTH